MAIETIETAQQTGQPATTNLFTHQIDRYLRRQDSTPARILRLLSTTTGADYRQSRWKRALDLSVSIPASLVSIPIVTVLAIAKKIEDGGSMFFTQERLSRERGIGVVKIRCMVSNCDAGIVNLEIGGGKSPSEDPRNTRLGSFMRRHQLEELPQLSQVALGQLSIIGIRAAPPYVFGFLQNCWPEEKYKRWREFYFRGTPGLSGLNQILGPSVKDDRRRYRLDAFYAEHASLGFDCYLLWRTLTKILSR
ncbi:MAG: sugar transferase [Candidatus Daviesbacteria bacterium]|nr:sugar transferase [Candidatus Daviesbacteria bacterium]